LFFGKEEAEERRTLKNKKEKGILSVLSLAE